MDRFDIVEAYYIWLVLHHCGVVPGTKDDPRGKKHPQYWMSYNRLSWMPTDLNYRPSSGLSPETLTEDGQEVYRKLCKRAGSICDCEKTISWKQAS